MLHLEASPALKSGVTLAIFQLSGILDLRKDRFIKNVNYLLNARKAPFKIFEDRFSIAEDLLMLISLHNFTTSSSRTITSFKVSTVSVPLNSH